MSLIVKKITYKETWENFLKECEEKTFLQSWNWGEFNQKMGYKIWRWGMYKNEQILAVAMVVKVEAKRGTFLFAPHLPSVVPLLSGTKEGELSNKQEILEALVNKLKEIGKQEKASFVRISPFWQRTKENTEIFKKLKFLTAPIHGHAEVTWELDITLPEEEMLKNMRKTTRYLIRRGQKDGVEVSQSRELEDMEEFGKLYDETVNRHHFVAFPPNYLKNELLSFLPDNEIIIFLGKYNNEIISSAIIVFWQDIAFYHHGASSAKFQKIPAAYTLLWEAIREAKRRGCKIFNFWGIAPTDSQKPRSENLSAFSKSVLFRKTPLKFLLRGEHPWAGLTLFKMGFGGYKRELIKTQDLPLSFKYWPIRIFEMIRKAKRRL